MAHRSVFAALVMFLCFACSAHSNGVVVFNAHLKSCATLVESNVNVTVENQIAVVTTTQTFRNDTHLNQSMQYAFPLPEGAAAIKLRWFDRGSWKTASLEAGADTGGVFSPGGDADAGLKSYLGETALNMPFDSLFLADSLMTVELTYVILLPYKYGYVSFSYPNNYSLVQASPVELQCVRFEVASPRIIESLEMTSHVQTDHTNNGHIAMSAWYVSEQPCNTNYGFRYKLSLTDLGMSGFSTRTNDTSGHFTFIVEPDPSSTNIIQKNFCFIVDRSGSMSTGSAGVKTKLEQAKAAAYYVVNNLNPGDNFNIIQYNNIIEPFSNSLVPFNEDTRNGAIAFIDDLIANGSTNIELALRTAISQFSSVPADNANIIVFLTDGQPTLGVTDPGMILSSIRDAVAATGRKITIFVFGLGADVNRQLLSELATQNNGVCELLGMDEVTGRITDFYNSIRNPVLISPTVSFSSDRVHEVYPEVLPNLYKGFQMIITGAYKPPLPMVKVTFKGTAFGIPLTYEYDLALADTAVPKYSFLPKLWAMQKIEHLLVLYNALPSTSALAKEYRGEIIRISLQYGVVSPFTSFSSTPTDVESPSSEAPTGPEDFVLLGNSPNPFNPGTAIHFRVASYMQRHIAIRIYNTSGVLVRTLGLDVRGIGEYSIYWDGLDSDGFAAPSGAYLYVVDTGEHIMTGKMQLLR
jgi:Ca-activated chloride channel family protein